MTIRVRGFIGSTLLVAALAFACGGDDPPGAKSAAAAASDTAKKPTKRTEQPLPAFSGWTLEDERLDVSKLIGKRLVLYVFDPDLPEAVALTEAVTRIDPLHGEHNFQVVGIAIGSTRETAKAFTARQRVAFPVIDDSSGRIMQRFNLRSPLAILGVDADGYMVWGFTQFATGAPDAAHRIETQLRTALRLPIEGDPAPGDLPLAPTFSASVLDQKERFDLASTRGGPVLLMFFLHTCPHCHEALRFLKTALAELPEDERPLLLGLELTGRTAEVRSTLQRDGLDFFPVLFEDGGEVTSAYGVFGGVPDLVLIDREGRIAARTNGWRGEVDGPLLRMRIAKLTGAPVPMLLRTKGYSGSEVCGVCHSSQHQTWLLTNHSWAFATLVKHGEESNPECVGCHVVGFGQEGGYAISPRSGDLENVGCESCHGRGGPHLSPGFVTSGDYRTACLGCHDIQHSLGFEYESFLPKVSHAANAGILALSADERRRILEERGAIRTDLLPTAASHVGSDACRSCHPKEYESWAAGAHAAALASLEKKRKAADADCLRCHTTGFGRKGGFPTGASASDHPDLARVGCESCHGPGGDHVRDDAKKLGSIVSLGDKCDSCVILQICGACHDDANDPGFEFEVQAKIEKIRHGTIEAGTGKPLEPGKKAARLPAAAMSEIEMIAAAFAEHESWKPR